MRLRSIADDGSRLGGEGPNRDRRQPVWLREFMQAVRGQGLVAGV